MIQTHISLAIIVMLILTLVNEVTIYFYSILYGAVIMTLTSIIEIYIEGLAKENELEYSRLRKWGSIGFCSATFIGGFIIIELGFKAIHLMGAVLYLVLLVLISTKFRNANKKIIRSANIKDVFKNRDAIVFGMLIFLTMGVCTGIDFAYPTYMVELVKEVELANRIYSTSITTKVVLEFFLMIVVGKYANKLNTKKVFIIIFVLCSLKMLLFYSGILYLVVLGDQLHGVIYSCYLVFIFKYIRDLVSDEYVGGTFSLIAVLAGSGSNLFYPSIFGAIQVQYGYEAMYMIAFIISLVAFVFSFKLLPSYNKNKVVSNIC